MSLHLLATDLMYKERNIMISGFIEAFFTQGKHFKIGIMMVTKNYHEAKFELIVHSQFLSLLCIGMIDDD